MKILRVICFFLAFSTASVGAKQPITISGFGFWVDENVFGSEFGDLRFEHVWLVAERQTDVDTKVVMILAARGQAQLVHDLRFHKSFPDNRFVTEFIAGRFIPPFSREWADIRIDRVGTVRYTGLSDSLVARDNGVQFNFRLGSWRSSLGLFAGERTNGYVAERDNTHRHFYFRLRRGLPFGLSLGGSYRWSTLDRRPWALELTRPSESALYAFELLRVDRATQWYALLERDLTQEMPWVGGRGRAVGRWEKLYNGERLVLGCGLFPYTGLTIKINYISEQFDSKTKKLLTQAIISF